MHNVLIKVFTLPHAEDLPLPTHATLGSAGVDLSAAIDSDISLEPLQRVLVPTGLTICLPIGYEAQIRPRSGLALKNGVTVLNSPGTIDCDYTGELKVVLINLSNETFIIQRGMRIAQMVIGKYHQVQWEIQKEPLSNGTRDKLGFGSTGV